MRRQEFASEEEMGVYAKEFLTMLTPNARGATIIGLSGDLGSGKTTFMKLVARMLGIPGDVVSPTYVLAKFYDIPKDGAWKKLMHVDAYRMLNPEEVRMLRWGEVIADPKNLIFVEWPEQIGGFFPNTAHLLKFEFVNETTRAIIDMSYDTLS